VNIRTQPSLNAFRAFTAPQGQRMDVLNQRVGADNQNWYQVRFTYQDATITGWVRADIVGDLDDCPELSSENPGPREILPD